jgi:hypothetical protein
VISNVARVHPFLFSLLLGLCVCAAFLISVSYTISYIGGWASLARHYACSDGFSGRRWSFESGRMRGIAGYSHCLTMGANSAGLYLSITLPPRIGHPALFIPWSEISVTRKKVLWFKRVQLRLGSDLSIPLQISEYLANKLKQSAGTSWPIESLT